MATETIPSTYTQPARLLVMVLVAFAAIATIGTSQVSAAAATRVGEGAPAALAAAMVKLYNTAGASNVGTPSNNGGGKTAHRWGSGWIQDFAGGPYGQSAIMVADGGNAAIVRNGLWWAYAALYGGAPGYLGYPTGNEQPYNGGARQSFAGGALEWHQGMDHARPPAIFFHGDKVAPCTGNGCGQIEASAVAAAPSLPMSGNKVD